MPTAVGSYSSGRASSGITVTKSSTRRAMGPICHSDSIHPPAGGWIESLWQIGPMARRVEDLVTVMPLLARPDEYDPTAVGMPVLDPAAVKLRDLRTAFY